jgi:hypothetical protein
MKMTSKKEGIFSLPPHVKEAIGRHCLTLPKAILTLFCSQAAQTIGNRYFYPISEKGDLTVPQDLWGLLKVEGAYHTRQEKWMPYRPVAGTHAGMLHNGW